MNCKKRDHYQDDHADRRIRYDWIIDEFGDDYDATDYEYHELTPEHTYMTYNDLDTLLGYMDSQNRVLCKEAGNGHCALAGPERMRLWCAGELKSAWQPLTHDEENELVDKRWYEPVRQFLADSLQEDSVMFNSIYESYVYLNELMHHDDSAEGMLQDLKSISRWVASPDATRPNCPREYFCGAAELMALVGRAPGRIFVLERELMHDIYCFEKDGNGGVNVTRELKLLDLDLDDTDTLTAKSTTTASCLTRAR